LTFTVSNLDIAVKKMEKPKTTILSSREQKKTAVCQLQQFYIKKEKLIKK